MGRGTIGVQQYVKAAYDNVFEHLQSMKALGIDSSDRENCNWLTSNLYVIEVMLLLTSRLVDDYQNKLDVAAKELKTLETQYAAGLAIRNNNIAKYQLLVD